MGIKLLSFSFLMTLIVVSKSHAVLWKSENVWNEAWEKKYSEWVSATVTPSFFKDHLISTDCADAPIAMRWIFAKENLLPMASSSGSDLITNLSKRWDSYETQASSLGSWKTDKRFQEALKDIINSTHSRTLFQDSYPIMLNSKNLTVGSMFINATKDSGHAEWISKLSFDGQQNPIQFYASTVPQIVRDLLVYPFMKVKWPEKQKNGFVKFRWAVENKGSVTLTLAEKMPGYSLEQYELGSANKIDFDDFIATRLIGHPLDGLYKIQNLASHLIERFENRVPVVAKGFEVCGGGRCAVESSKFYDHSTYSRDGAIVFLIQGIFELLYSDRYLNVDDQMAGQMTLRWSQIQTEISVDIEGSSYSLGQLVSNWNQSLFSSDPNDPIKKRWGL